MGNIVGRIDSRLIYIKFSNNNQVSLTIDMINASSVLKYLPSNINDYGINTKISLLSIFTNILNNPDPILSSDDIQQMYNTLKENIITNLTKI